MISQARLSWHKRRLSRCRKCTVSMLILAVFLIPLPMQAVAQDKTGTPWDEAHGNADVYREVKHDVSPHLRDIEPSHQPSGLRRVPVRRIPHLTVLSTATAAEQAIQATVEALLPTTPGLNFEAIGEGFVGSNGGTFFVTSAPPDTNGAVGSTQYVQWVNTSFAVFDKSTGSVIFGPVDGNTLWTGFGGPCQTDNDGDVTAQYDKASNRWVMTQFAVTGGPPFYQCVAISQTPDATGAYNRYAFSFSNFNDYPKLGVWTDAYYMSFNMFQGKNFVGSRVCALDRDRMLNGLSATMQCFQLGASFGGLLPSDLDGIPPPPGSPNYFLNFGTNSLNLWKFHVDWVTPANTTLTGPTNIPVAAFSEACGGGTCIPQPGTSQQLDSLGDRLMYRLAYRNFGDHEALVVNHSVTAGSSVGVRWYELRNPATTPIVYQQGTYAPDSKYRWMGSIAMDQIGNMALGYSVSSGLLFPSISYTGRVPGDALGTMESENTIIAGAGSQTNTLERWGDYSSMSIDPVDECSFWYTNEYLKTSGTFNWNTRVASFKFPTCGTASQLSRLGVFRDGTWFLDYNGNGLWDGCGTDLCASFGIAGDIPVAGDWNRSGTGKIGVFRNGTWFLDYNGNGLWDGCGTDLCISFGIPGDIPVAGDWNGSGTSKIGVFRNGTWFLDDNGNGLWDGCGITSGTDRCYAFGLSTDTPVAGDWNGNEYTEIGTRRSANWFLDYSGEGSWNGCAADKCGSFGLSADKPVAGKW